ncbi:MAG: prolyl oligopeptidase family serine peptidase [Phycisphaerae bacterium]
MVRQFTYMATVCIVLCARFGVAQGVEQEDREASAIPTFQGDQWLVIEPVGRYGRYAIHKDSVEKQIVDGTWRIPQVADVVRAANGDLRQWKQVSTNANGELKLAALRGGYAWTTVNVDQPMIAILEAAGHSIVYVNGTPRVGDPYATGWNRIPVQLKSGENHFLFHCRRGFLRAKLSEPPAFAFLNKRDTTTPDLRRRGETTTQKGRDFYWAGIPVINATAETLDNLMIETTFLPDESDEEPGTNTDRARYTSMVSRVDVLPIPPMASRKAPMTLFDLAQSDRKKETLIVKLLQKGSRADEFEVLHQVELDLRVRDEDQWYKRTFISDIDGSVQYYTVVPQTRPESNESTTDDGEAKSDMPGLILSLHGASVEATNQAAAYRAKDWAHIVAPTNRRPYGFDWEDWGRWDALEVLKHAEEELKTDPQRTYLTGHSMGGHGTWHLGTLFPGRFAAIAPSASWVSFRSYAGQQPEKEDPRDQMLNRAASASDTLARKMNLVDRGVYVLHGDEDNNVPVEQARIMRTELAGFHADFAYYERKNAGHWWGNQCMDWPPLMEFLKQRSLPKSEEEERVLFYTPSPAVSASRAWVSVVSQQHPLAISSVDLRRSLEKRSIVGTTDNIGVFVIDLKAAGLQQQTESDQPIRLTLDGQRLTLDGTASQADKIWLSRFDGQWQTQDAPDPTQKNPQRYGPFKEAFNNRFMLVYGTTGTPAENEWALNRARLDAESFGYRGNGAPEILPDWQLDAEATSDRNIILYGNEDTNMAFDLVIENSPVRIGNQAVTLGDRNVEDDDLACLFIRPRKNSEHASVGVVGGTGLEGMRLTDRIPYFVSGAGFPDCLLIESSVLTDGVDGVLATGFFGIDWTIETGDFAYAPQLEASTK